MPLTRDGSQGKESGPGSPGRWIFQLQTRTCLNVCEMPEFLFLVLLLTAACAVCLGSFLDALAIAT